MYGLGFKSDDRFRMRDDNLTVLKKFNFIRKKM